MNNKKGKNENIHAGSSFDNFVKEEGIFERWQEVGTKYACNFKMREKQQLTKEEFARQIGTSRSTFGCLLDPIRLQMSDSLLTLLPRLTNI